MDVESFVQGPLLTAVFGVFFLGVMARIVFSLSSFLKSKHQKGLGWRYIPVTVARSFLPFYKAITKRPVYTILRYIYHIFLVVVPVWLAGHIILLESSWLALSWKPIPDNLADWMTLVFIGLCVIFLVRRIILGVGRGDANFRDFMLIIISGLTFSSGYFLAHGTLDNIPFFANNMFLIHVLCGEAMLAMAVFLFIRSRLDRKKCTGCAACETSCPTGTLEFEDRGGQRIFSYSHYQCICCGACVGACPERAAEIRHDIAPSRFFKIAKKYEIRSVDLLVCEGCGTLFAPEPQLQRISETVAGDYINFCSRCKKVKFSDAFRRISPWPKKTKTPTS